MRDFPVGRRIFWLDLSVKIPQKDPLQKMLSIPSTSWLMMTRQQWSVGNTVVWEWEELLAWDAKIRIKILLSYQQRPGSMKKMRQKNSLGEIQALECCVLNKKTKTNELYDLFILFITCNYNMIISTKNNCMIKSWKVKIIYLGNDFLNEKWWDWINSQIQNSNIVIVIHPTYWAHLIFMNFQKPLTLKNNKKSHLCNYFFQFHSKRNQWWSAFIET